MTLLEIKAFLISRPGYQKEGGKRLRDTLTKKGFTVTTNLCKQALKEVRGGNNLITTRPLKRLFYDIEVSYGLARVWRPGYNINVSYDDFIKHPTIICISYKWGGEDEVYSVRWDSNQSDKSLLEVFLKSLNEADEVVGHNSKSFDTPWIRTRCVFHGITNIKPNYKEIDTLKIARGKFRFPSNRLDALGDYLGVGRKIKTNRELWIDTVCKGDKKALEKMVEYCDQDVLLLEDVYNKLITQELPSTHVGTLAGGIKQSSPYTGKTNIELVQTSTSKSGTKKHMMKCLDTNRYFEMSDTDYRKHLEINN